MVVAYDGPPAVGLGDRGWVRLGDLPGETLAVGNAAAGQDAAGPDGKRGDRAEMAGHVAAAAGPDCVVQCAGQGAARTAPRSGVPDPAGEEAVVDGAGAVRCSFKPLRS